MNKKSISIILFILFGLISNRTVAQFIHTANWHWAQKARCYSQIAPLDMMTDKNGKIWMTGFYVGDAQFGTTTIHNNSSSGYYDIFLATLVNGSWTSIKSYGDSSAEIGRALCMDSSGNIYLLSTFFSDSIFVEGQWYLNHSNSGEILISKYKPNGTCVWVKHFGGSGWDEAYTLKLSSDNHLWIGGDFDGANLPFGSDTLYQHSGFGDADAFVARLDTNGNVTWARSFYSNSNESLWKLAPLPDGQMAAAFVSDGSQLHIPPTTVSNPLSENFLAAFDSTGQTLWAKAIQCTGTNDIATDSSGNIFFCSAFPYDSISVDGNNVHALLNVGWTGSNLLASFNKYGALNWAQCHFASYYLDYTHLLTDDSGYVYLYGIPNGTIGGVVQVGDSLFSMKGLFFFAKTNPANGEMIWQETNDNITYSTETISACFDHKNNFTVSGSIYLPGNVVFGQNFLTYTNTTDLFMLYVAQFNDSLFEKQDTLIVDPPPYELNLFPNPFSNTLTISINDSSIHQLQIFSVDGKLMFSSAIETGITTLKTMDWANGTYVAELTGNSKKKIFKLVKI